MSLLSLLGDVSIHGIMANVESVIAAIPESFVTFVVVR